MFCCVTRGDFIDTIRLMKYTEFIASSLGRAAEIARKNFGKVTSSKIKNGNSVHVLTETDLEIGSMIVEAVGKEFPDHNIIDEEAGIIDNDSEYTWVVDPIDGTSNFAQGVPQYGILLGLLENGTPVAGGISLPSLSELYIAEKGSGAFCNGRKITVSDEPELSNSLIAYGIDGHKDDPGRTRKECKLLGSLVLEIRNLRSSNSVYDFAMVACGKYGAFLNQTSKIWDNVASQIIIEEAEGVHTDFYGKPIDYSDPLKKAGENSTHCAAAPEVHSQIQTVIRNSE